MRKARLEDYRWGVGGMGVRSAGSNERSKKGRRQLWCKGVKGKCRRKVSRRLGVGSASERGKVYAGREIYITFGKIFVKYKKNEKRPHSYRYS